MKKENLNTTENKKTQEEKIMKKFVDEEYYLKKNSEEKLNDLYEFIALMEKDIPKYCNEEMMELYEVESPRVNEFKGNILKFIDDVHSAYVLEQIKVFGRIYYNTKELKKYKEDDIGWYVARIVAFCSECLNMMYRTYSAGIYSINGKYKKVKIKYADFKCHIEFPFGYVVKKGEYDAQDKTIEIYINEDYNIKEHVGWFCGLDNRLISIKKGQGLKFAERMREFNKENEIQGEKVMKKEIIIGMVENTYEIVGKSRTINNCTGIDNIKLRDAAIYIFGNNEEEENENKKLLVDYYKNQPEEFFDSYELSGEELVGRMAKDLIKAKTNAPEFDEWDLWKMDEQIMAEAEVFRAEFLNTYRKLDTKDDELEKYLTNFLTSYRVWFDLSKDTDGSFYLIKKIYENDTKFGGDPYTGIVYEMKNWAEYVEEVAAWLNDIMNIAIEFGTYSTNGKYKTVDYENYISLKTDININIYEMECVAKNTINKIWDLRYRNRDEISLLRLMVKEIYVEDEEERDEDEPDAKYGKIVGFYIADKEKK